jgi:diguanylate cyclase (GGDEF)-like protein
LLNPPFRDTYGLETPEGAGLQLEDMREAVRRDLDRTGFGLAFGAALEQCYETETAGARIRHLVRAGVLAMVLSNFFLLTDRQLVPDAFGWSLVLHVACTILYSAVLVYTAGDPPAWRREAAQGFCLTVALVGTISLFAISRAPTRDMLCNSFVLFTVYVNVVMRLRFEWCVAFNAAGVAAALLAILLGTDMPPAVRELVALSLLTATAFTMYANYAIEAAERRGFLLMLDQRLSAEQLTQYNTRLNTLSRTDWLTGVANRRGLELHLADLWRQASAGRGALSLLMIDVDHFKLFNDLHGHQHGDSCLAVLATLIGQQLRPGQDFMARYGGEEFAVCLPDTGLAAATATAERIRQAVEDLGLTHGAPGAGQLVTVSIGADAAEPASGGSPEALIAGADRALYVSKQAGRNRVYPGLAKTRPGTLAGRSEALG